MENEVMAQMPKYRSHKEVWALKIKAVQQVGDSVIMHFENESFSPRQESTENRPKPDVGWYFVQYENSYHSFSPAKSFEEGYALVDTKIKGAS